MKKPGITQFTSLWILLLALALSVFPCKPQAVQAQNQPKTSQEAQNKLKADLENERQKQVNQAESDASKAKADSTKTIENDHQKKVEALDKAQGDNIKAAAAKADTEIGKNNDEIRAREKLITEYEQRATGVSDEEKANQVYRLTKEIDDLQKKNDQVRAETKKTMTDILDKTNLAVQEAEKAKKEALEKAEQKIKADLEAKKKEIQKQIDFQKAIELDKETFNVGLILKANNQKTFFEKAKTSNRPVIVEVIDHVTTFLLRLVIPLAAMALIIGGYYLMFAQGEESMLNTGKSILTNTVIGLVLIFTSFLIVQFVISIFYQ